jgi:hypothetical protein
MTTQTVKFEYDAKNNVLFTEDDFEIASREDVDAFWKLYRDQLERIGKKVRLVTKIDGLYIMKDVEQYYGEVARAVSQQWYITFARYGATATGRLGIRQAGAKTGFVTSVHKTRDEAVAAVLNVGAP